MADSTELATVRPQAISISEQMAFAREAANANIIPEAYRRSPANVLIAVGFGQSMGLSPAESLYRINVIQGKPTASAELIAAQVRKAGHKLRLTKDEAAQSVTCTIVRADDPKFPISVTRDKTWAQAMNLANKDNYRKQAMTMLTWRAITACAREACPEALYGVAYTPDEMGDFAEATAPQAPQMPVVDLQPIRDRIRLWSAANGTSLADGTKRICAKYGVSHMEELSQAQVTDAVKAMDIAIAEARAREAVEETTPEASVPADVNPETGEVTEPELYDGDVTF
jgi:hypothetical protein